MHKNWWILFSVLIIASCATSHVYKLDMEAIGKTFVPRDLRKNNRILLLKMPNDDDKELTNLNKFMTDNYSGKFEIVKLSRSIDKNYPDTSIYKYVLVFAGAIKETDFQGISNKEIFFDKTDGTFTRTGSSLYIFDRTSNHDLYETGGTSITYSMSTRDNIRGVNHYYDFILYQKLKTYLEILENY